MRRIGRVRRARQVVGFYTDSKGRRRPITRRIRVRVKPTTYVRQGKVIHRRGYTYLRKDVGKPGKGPKVIPIKKGKLTRYGYSTKKSAAARHRALAKAVRAYGATRVWRMLHAQVILRKRTQPRARQIFERDRDWVKQRYGVGS